MNYSFKNAEDLLKGIGLVCDDLGIKIVNSDADIEVTVCESKQNVVNVSLSEGQATITYGGGKSRFFRGLAMLVDWVNRGETHKEITQTPLFVTNGAMVDMSRNTVMKVSSVECMMRKMALMGLNVYMLYTEDTYEIENRPYFGYMRGRYTKAEIKEMDAYAKELGIELIPCVQVLGHLATHLRWGAATKYKDTPNVILVGEEETYQLIDDMLKTVSECFTSRRIHIGMDETHDLGTGRYLDLFGYRERSSLYFEHIQRVYKMVESYGLKPMMWSDMFFRLSGKNIKDFVDYDVRVELDESLSEKVPKGIQQIFWDYYNPDEEFYSINIDKHKQYLDENMIFAGGIWHWSGHAPHYSRSLRNTLPALEACRKKGVSEVLATVWHNGSEACLMMALTGLAWYADYDYTGGFNLESVKQCLQFSCGISYDDIVKCELVEYPHGGQVGISKALLYNDPLMGLIDKHIEGMDTEAYYQGVTEQLEAVTGEKGVLASAFDVIVKLSSLLENKANFGVRLKKAYDAKDAKTLENMAEECDVILGKIKALRDSHYTAWMEYNKPQGWEVHDMRYGALSARFETAKQRILAYLSNEISNIAELEEERLRFDGRPDDADKFDGSFLWMRFQSIMTANIL